MSEAGLVRFPARSPPTVLEGVGVIAVAVGFFVVGGVAGLVGAVAVAALLFVLSGVYAFAAGQFVVAVTLPARLTPELVLLEAALVLVLVGGATTPSRWSRLVVGGATLVVAVGVGAVAVGRVTDVAVLVVVAVVLLTATLSLVVRSDTRLQGQTTGKSPSTGVGSTPSPTGRDEVS